MFGPVRITIRASRSSVRSFGVTGLPARASSTGCRPSTIVERVVPIDRRAARARGCAPPRPATANTSSRASARAVVRSSAARAATRPAHLLEQLVLEPAPPLVGAEHLGLVLLQLRRHVPLGAGQRLAAHVLGGHPRGLRVGHLDAVAEDAIEADAQAGDPGARALALLEAGDPLPRLARVPDDRARARRCQLSRMRPPSWSAERGLVVEGRRQQSRQVVERRQLGERVPDRSPRRMPGPRPGCRRAAPGTRAARRGRARGPGRG